MSLISRIVAAGFFVFSSGCYKAVFDGRLRSGDVKLEESLFGKDYRMRIDGRGFSFGFYDKGMDGIVDEFAVYGCNPGLWKCSDFKMAEAQRMYEVCLREIIDAGVCNLTCPVSKPK